MNIKALTDGIFKRVHAYVAPAFAAVDKRMDELAEQIKSIPAGRDGKDGKDGQDGRSITLEDIAPMLRAAVAELPPPAAGRDGRDGKDAPAVDTEALAAAVLAKISPPKDGRDGRDGVNGKDGHSVTLAEVTMLVQAAVKDIPAAAPGRDGKDGAPGLNGKDGEPGAAGKDGAPGRDGAKGIDGARGEKGDTGPAGATGEQGPQGLPGDTGPAGKDADPAVIKSMIEEGIARELPNAVQKALDVMIPMIVQRAAELVPRPADGKDGAPGRDGGEGRPGKDGADGKSVELSEVVEKLLPLIPKPRDGIDGKDAPPVDTAAVVETIVKLLPPPKEGAPGRDGERGETGEKGADGKSITAEDIRPILECEISKGVLDLERRATDTLQRAVERLQQPKDGIDGKDGRDGLSLEDFDAKMDGRVLTLAMRCGDKTVERSIKLDIPMDKGVFRSAQSYEKGDVVTYGGSQWIAITDTKASPPGDGWRCQVQRGKDGKDAK